MVVVVDLTFYSLPMTHTQFVVLSDVQRMMSRILLRTEEQVTEGVRNQLLLALLLWMGISGLVGIVVWGYSMSLFL